MGPAVSTYLVEGIEQIRDQWRARGWSAKSLHQTKLLQVANVAICGILAESQRVAPEIPLEGDDGDGHHTDPEEGQSGLSACETRVQET